MYRTIGFCKHLIYRRTTIFCIFAIKQLTVTTKNYILSTLRLNKPNLSKFGVRQIGLFGSYVHNKQSNKSDIDILIDFEPDKENYDNFMAVYDFFEDLFQNEKVEIVTTNGLSPYIGPKILQEVEYV